MCYTYDNLSRVTTRVIKKASDNTVISTENFTYDAAGNITDAPESCFAYDTNNRLTVFCGQNVSYDLDGNMLSNGSLTCTYDSANRLTSAGGHTYTYNAENIRIRNLCSDADTTYVYDTNAKLSKLLCKTTNGITTKYVYGRGLIGEEKCGNFKTYHFDCRGSTIAITDICGNITDTFAYDTYGRCISHTGNSFVIFGYNGSDGVVTDTNGLIYMRARYYSPEMKRFINADIIAGKLSNAITLNRFAYANGNPVSFIDPSGHSAKSQFAYTTLVDENYKRSVYTGHQKNYSSQPKYARQSIFGTPDFWYDTIVDVSSFVFEKAAKAVDNFTWAFLNSIECEAGVGYGLGYSRKIGTAKIEIEAYSDNFTIALDDSDVFMYNAGSAGISASLIDNDKGSIGVSGSYTHEYVDRPNDCLEHNAWSNPLSLATCKHADQNPFGLTIPIKGKVNADVSEDIVLGISGSKHFILGYHYSVGININQFLDELFD